MANSSGLHHCKGFLSYSSQAVCRCEVDEQEFQGQAVQLHD